MTKTKRCLLSILAGLQSPIIYVLSGHSLFIRESGLGYMWYMMVTLAVGVYWFLYSFEKIGSK
jgi:hypothetical protein